MGRVVGKYTHEKAHGTQAALNFPTPNNHVYASDKATLHSTRPGSRHLRQ